MEKAHLYLLSSNYDFYKRKSENLVVTLQSARILAVFYGMSFSKPAATFKLQFLQMEKQK